VNLLLLGSIHDFAEAILRVNDNEVDFTRHAWFLSEKH
jgi:hypothetical protein